MPDANTSAIVLTASNVSIDLNGFSIIGPAQTGQGIGIDDQLLKSDVPGLSVSNGVISGMGNFGIRFLGGVNSVNRVQVSQNGGGGIIQISGSFFTQVSSSSAYFNGGPGIRSDAVSDSVAIGNQGDGIDGDSIVSNNTASFNGGNGIVGFGVLIGNSARNNGAAGISASCPSNVVNNLAP